MHTEEMSVLGHVVCVTSLVDMRAAATTNTEGECVTET